MFDRTTTDLLKSKREHIMRILGERTMIDFYKIGSTGLDLENEVELVGMTNGEFQITYKDHWMLTQAECSEFNHSIRASYYMGADVVMDWVETIEANLKD
jgi:hypothetical protein